VSVHINRTARNLGRVQFKAAWKKIQGLLEEGYDFKTIHRMLTDEGKLTICYSAFCDYLAKVRPSENYLGQMPPKMATLPGETQTRRADKGPPSNPPGVPTNRAWASKSEPFSIDRSRPAEELM
jgi:hypothetical protein